MVVFVRSPVLKFSWIREFRYSRFSPIRQIIQRYLKLNKQNTVRKSLVWPPVDTFFILVLSLRNLFSCLLTGNKDRIEEIMAKRKYDDCFLKPEITQAGEFQVFKMKGKDARGYNWMVRLAAISEETYPADLPETAGADRVEMYVGGKPVEIDKISGEMEIKLGKEGEKYNIDKAMMVYIPKGTAAAHRLVRKPEEISWLLNFTLPPKQETPEEKKGGK
jgi:hypothetical protein